MPNDKNGLILATQRSRVNFKSKYSDRNKLKYLLYGQIYQS